MVSLTLKAKESGSHSLSFEEASGGEGEKVKGNTQYNMIIQYSNSK